MVKLAYMGWGEASSERQSHFGVTAQLTHTTCMGLEVFSVIALFSALARDSSFDVVSTRERELRQVSWILLEKCIGLICLSSMGGAILMPRFHTQIEVRQIYDL